MCCPLVFEFSVGVGGFVIGLSHISFFFFELIFLGATCDVKPPPPFITTNPLCRIAISQTTSATSIVVFVLLCHSWFLLSFLHLSVSLFSLTFLFFTPCCLLTFFPSRFLFLSFLPSSLSCLFLSSRFQFLFFLFSLSSFLIFFSSISYTFFSSLSRRILRASVPDMAFKSVDLNVVLFRVLTSGTPRSSNIKRDFY